MKNCKYFIQVFRFEDIALDPIETAHEVYQFLGLHFPNSVKEWIHSNTKLDRWKIFCFTCI